MKLPILYTFVIALGAQVQAQSTWYVDGTGTSPGTGSSFDPYTSIQYAIEQPSTVDGDTVQVRPGVYVESVNLLGKSISLISDGGAGATTISAVPYPAPAVPVVTFGGGGVASSTISGFRIINGRSPDDFGGGIRCIDGSLLVQNCVVTENCSAYGVIWASNSDLELRSCEIVDNLDSPGVRSDDSILVIVDCAFARQHPIAFAGGVELHRSCAVVQRCSFVDTSASSRSAVYSSDSDLWIESCEFRQNFGYFSSSPLCVEGGSVHIEGTGFVNNGSTSGGGAATLFDTDATVISSHFESNGAGYSGGALMVEGSGTLFVGATTFLDNSSVRGGAVALESGSAVFSECWFQENRTYQSVPICCGQGGAILAEPEVDSCVARECVFIGNRANGSTQYAPATGGAVTGPVVLSKCTIVGNYARDAGGGVFGGDQYGGPGAFLEDCIVYGNSPDQVAGTASVVFSDVQGGWPGTGNLDADPLFIDARNDNYHLAPGSPCVDVGNRSGAPDLDGSRADVGAFQFVDCNGNGVVDAIDIAMGTSVDLNGNSFPDECECLAYNYCELSPHSTGPGASMGLAGSTSISQNDFVLIANGCPPNKNGIFFYGTAQHQAPFGDGIRCVFGQVFRLTIVNSGPQGIAAFPLNYDNPPQPSGQITAGSRWNFQFWFRDPMGPGGTGFNLSDGLEVVFCP